MRKRDVRKRGVRISEETLTPRQLKLLRNGKLNVIRQILTPKQLEALRQGKLFISRNLLTNQQIKELRERKKIRAMSKRDNSNNIIMSLFMSIVRHIGVLVNKLVSFAKNTKKKEALESKRKINMLFDDFIDTTNTNQVFNSAIKEGQKSQINSAKSKAKSGLQPMIKRPRNKTKPVKTQNKAKTKTITAAKQSKTKVSEVKTVRITQEKYDTFGAEAIGNKIGKVKNACKLIIDSKLSIEESNDLMYYVVTKNKNVKSVVLNNQDSISVSAILLSIGELKKGHTIDIYVGKKIMSNLTYFPRIMKDRGINLKRFKCQI